MLISLVNHLFVEKLILYKLVEKLRFPENKTGSNLRPKLVKSEKMDFSSFTKAFIVDNLMTIIYFLNTVCVEFHEESESETIFPLKFIFYVV